MSLALGPDLPEVSRAAVFGLAKSGRATVRALLDRGVSVVATDAAQAETLGALPSDERLELVLGSHPPSLLAGVNTSLSLSFTPRLISSTNSCIFSWISSRSFFISSWKMRLALKCLRNNLSRLAI